MRSRARLGRALRSRQLNRPTVSQLVGEELVAAEAGVALATVGVEDPEGRPPARRTGPVAGHNHLRSLADDVAPEPDPRATSELEPDPGRLADRAGEAGMQARGLEDGEGDTRPSGEGGEAAESIGDLRPARDLLGQVDDEQVDGSTREQGAGDHDPLVDVRRRHDDEPLELDASGHRLDGVKGHREVQPRDDRAGCLGLGGKPQGERRPAARQVAPERDAHAARQAARAEDRVERREASRENLRGIRLAAQPAGVLGLVVGHLERRGRERAHDLADSRGSGRAPPRPEGRESRRHVRGKCRHGWDYRTSVRMNQALNGRSRPSSHRHSAAPRRNCSSPARPR